MTRLLIAVLAFAAPFASNAFKLQMPVTAPVEKVVGAAGQQAGFLLQFGSDVHERITRLAYDAAGEKLSDDVITGVRWNDNPPALRMSALMGGCGGDMGLAEGMDCWTSMMRVDRMAMEAVSRREKSIAPLRSHFGDMQFLHAMAAREGESAQETREKALRFAEFAYRVARGEIPGRANVHDLPSRRTGMDPAASAWLADLFRAPSKKHWTVQDIFLAHGQKLRAVAFGSLLHLVEDSYSAAHVERASTGVQANGCPSYDAADAIVEFHTYSGQDTQKHGLCDDPPDWLDSPRAGSPIDPIAALVRAYRDGHDWPVVKKILEEQVFRLAERTAPAGVGRCFRLDLDASLAAGGEPLHPTALEASCRQ